MPGEMDAAAIERAIRDLEHALAYGGLDEARVEHVMQQISRLQQQARRAEQLGLSNDELKIVRESEGDNVFDDISVEVQFLGLLLGIYAIEYSEGKIGKIEYLEKLSFLTTNLKMLSDGLYDAIGGNDELEIQNLDLSERIASLLEQVDQVQKEVLKPVPGGHVARLQQEREVAQAQSQEEGITPPRR